MKIHSQAYRPHEDQSKVVERNQAQAKETPQSGQTQTQRTDSYTPSEKIDPGVYEKPTVKPDMKTIERLKAESEQHYQQLKELVRQLLEQQGYTFEEAQAGSVTVEVDEDTRLQAEAAISEGGTHSVEAVSDRLVEFAIAISGGDRSKLDTLKAAIEEGFRAAEEIFGGTLPNISYQTLEATMEKLDQWATEVE